MTYLAWFVLLFTTLRLLVAMVNLFTRQWLRPGVLEEEPLVSVLIPARNEEKNIGNILNDLLTHDYSNLEIWVYDDLSEDHTWQAAMEYAAKDPRVQVLKGGELPQGWLGKNHGCHRLSLHATGEYLLYLDADVNIKKGLIKNAVAHMKKHDLDLFSMFPKQNFHSLGEWLIVPHINQILVSLLPLVFTRISSWASFSAANGQFMLFRSSVYHNETFHKAMRHSNVEDIMIFRYMKEKGFRVHTMLGNRQVNCRMYQSWGEAVKGLGRSVFHFFGGSKLLTFIYGLITTFGFFAVLAGLPAFFSVVYLAMVVVLRVVVSLQSRQNVLLNVILAPLQQIAFLFVIVKAAKDQYRKTTTWKGRVIDK